MRVAASAVATKPSMKCPAEAPLHQEHASQAGDQGDRTGGQGSRCAPAPPPGQQGEDDHHDLGHLHEERHHAARHGCGKPRRGLPSLRPQATEEAQDHQGGVQVVTPRADGGVLVLHRAHGHARKRPPAPRRRLQLAQGDGHGRHQQEHAGLGQHEPRRHHVRNPGQEPAVEHEEQRHVAGAAVPVGREQRPVEGAMVEVPREAGPHAARAVEVLRPRRSSAPRTPMRPQSPPRRRPTAPNGPTSPPGRGWIALPLAQRLVRCMICWSCSRV